MWPKALKVCVCCTPREEKKPSPKAEAPSKGSGSLRTDSRWDPKHSTCCHQQPWPLAVGLREQGSLSCKACVVCARPVWVAQATRKGSQMSLKAYA